MKINRKLLPIKAHFFFFMCAMGPILPQLFVYGKELGISSVVMGSITGLLPFLFLLAKPLFGLIVDVYRDYRKAIFMLLIVLMTVSFAFIAFIPERKLFKLDVNSLDQVEIDFCGEIDIQEELKCTTNTVNVQCSTNCSNEGLDFLVTNVQSSDFYRLCTKDANRTISFNARCNLHCTEDIETVTGCLYSTWSFWIFIFSMSIGCIGFNVINSISDAICCDVIGDEHDYGKQRVWGTIGFGLTALIAGYIMNIFSGSSISYTPAFIVMVIFSLIDILACFKLELPVIEAPQNIIKEFMKILKDSHVITFMGFAVCAGILDGIIIYFLFWYIEDLAIATNTENIKLLEGLIVAGQTLGGEVIFFSVSGKILSRFGHVHCFSMCFVNYALRLGLISLAPTPWWILPIEFVFQGPTYALTYTTIVAYANELAPAGASATMQGIAAGMDDGVGYAIGSLIGGILFKYIGGRHALQLFSIFGLVCSIAHLVLHKTLLLRKKEDKTEYNTPEEALKVTYSGS